MPRWMKSQLMEQVPTRKIKTDVERWNLRILKGFCTYTHRTQTTKWRICFVKMVMVWWMLIFFLSTEFFPTDFQVFRTHVVATVYDGRVYTHSPVARTFFCAHPHIFMRVHTHAWLKVLVALCYHVSPVLAVLARSLRDHSWQRPYWLRHPHDLAVLSRPKSAGEVWLPGQIRCKHNWYKRVHNSERPKVKRWKQKQGHIRRRRLKELKAKTKCRTCGRKGHWANESECAMSSSCWSTQNQTRTARMATRQQLADRSVFPSWWTQWQRSRAESIVVCCMELFCVIVRNRLDHWPKLRAFFTNMREFLSWAQRHCRIDAYQGSHNTEETSGRYWKSMKKWITRSQVDLFSSCQCLKQASSLPQLYGTY